MKDSIERYLDEWNKERPDLDVAALAVTGRIDLLAKRFRRQARKALRSFDLQLWEYDVLAVLRRQGEPYQLSPTDLAKLVMLTTGAMTNRVDRLEERGFVERRPDPNDRRSLLVRLKEEGKRCVDDALEARMRCATESISPLSRSERRTLEALLKTLMLESE